MKGILKILPRFLGSMNLAISLLIAVAIASVIGTLLKQNEAYQSYIIKFGPFWHEVYQSLGLYDVYSSAWFIAILAFLVVSTSICVLQNGPAILQSMQKFRADISSQSLRTMPQHEAWQSDVETNDALQGLDYFFRKSGFRTRIKTQDSSHTLAAMNGASNRLGYLLTHVAIVVICLGGLLDGNLPLKIKTLTGEIRLEKDNDAKVSEIPKESFLGTDNPSFRGSVTIPEGSKVNIAFLNIADGYLVQELPFAVEVEDFQIEHYESGQPKSFKSELVIHDLESKETLHETISVNYPLSYKGYTIYQSSFSDGGSALDMVLHQLRDKNTDTLAINGNVNESLALDTIDGQFKLEFDEFRLFNIFPAAEDDLSGKKFIDQGPNFTFKLRKEDGSAVEFVNYMYPLDIEGRLYFLSGTRNSPVDEYRYLHIPADENQSLERFLKFQAIVHDDEKVLNAANMIAEQDNLIETDSEFVSATEKLIRLFLQGGFEPVKNHINKNVPAEHQEEVFDVYSKILQRVFQQLYLDLLETEGIEIDEQNNEEELQFFQDALLALSALPFYESPFFIELQDFQHREASGLQITKTPGKIYVYIGFTMLIVGVFLLFYVSHERYWVILSQNKQQTEILFAGNTNRNKNEFAEKFKQLTDTIKAELKPLD